VEDRGEQLATIWSFNPEATSLAVVDDLAARYPRLMQAGLRAPERDLDELLARATSEAPTGREVLQL
jgi:hypothetical protein